jgi:predicted dehydrogenase
MTGLLPDTISANLKIFEPARALDDYGHAVIRYENGGLGTVTASQISHGRENDLRIQIDGTLASLEWHQENPNQMIVRKNGEPVPFAEIEVEYVNDGSVKAPNDAFVTQVIKADAQGVFAYAMPRAGWWGFAALMDDDKTMKSPDGKDAKVELGGLIWVKATDMTGARPPARRQ